MTRIIRFLFVAASLALLTSSTARAQQYYWGNYAGLPGTAGSQDGKGTAALFSAPNSTACDSNGNIYVADTSNNTIRKITPAGVSTTLAGSPGVSGSSDGTGSAALFNHPTGIAVKGDGSAIYVADSLNYTIRVVSAGGVVTTLAGSPGVSDDIDGTGSGAAFGNPVAVATDGNGNIYVADSVNNTIRLVTTGGVVTTFAGTPGQAGTTDGTGTSAQFNTPSGVATNGSGLIYVADTLNNSIRQVTSAGVVTTVAGAPPLFGSLNGIGTAAQFYYPSGLAVDSTGNVYIADTFNQTVRVMTPSGSVTTLAGTPVAGNGGKVGDTDAAGTSATFNNPTGVAVDGNGNVYVADSGNNTIRKISYGVVTTFADGAHWGIDWPFTTVSGSTAHFNYPMGIAADSSGNLYVADTNNHGIRKIAPTSAVVTDFAGTINSSVIGYSGSKDGTGTAAQFFYPTGLAIDGSGNLYVADTFNQTIRKMVLSSGVVTTLCGTAGAIGSADGTTSAARFNYPTGIAVNSAGTNIYVADTYNHTIRQITSAGVSTTIAGTANTAGSTDGPGTAALFDYPSGVAVDSTGNIYVADSGNCTIRKLTVSSGTWTSSTFAGSTGVTGSTNGTGSAALFNNPTCLSIDSANNLYVVDTGNNTIRMVTPAGVVTTIGGTPGVIGTVNGIGTAGQFSSPSAVAVGSAGLYVLDGGNNRVSLGSIAGTMPATLVAGTTATLNGNANANGVADHAEFQYGTTTAYASTTALQSISGTSFAAVSANITGLLANTTYHYRLVLLVNGTITYYGTDQTFTTSATAVPGITNSSLASGTQGIAYSAQMTASNLPTSWSASPLPTGLSANPLTGAITGTPTGTGTTSVVLSATNAAGTGTKTLSLVVNALPLPVLSNLTANAVQGTNCLYIITATNFPTSYNATGLPTGFILNPSTGQIMGVPQVSGNFSVTISATNLTGTTTATLNLTVLPPYTWSTFSGTPGAAGSADGNAFGIGLLNRPAGVATDSNGNVYVADTTNSIIRKITPAGVMTTLAGAAGQTGSQDGTGSQARFNNPTGLVVDGSGNIYVADCYNCTIRKITPAGVVTTLAGIAGVQGSANGTGNGALFSYPYALTVDGSTGNIYVADSSASTIRAITPAGVVTTLVGTYVTTGSTDGIGAAARFNIPRGIVADGKGNLYVADSFNSTIRKVTTAGVVTTIAGTALQVGGTDGTGTAAQFNYPYGITIDGNGNLYVADSQGSTIRKITSPSVVTTAAVTTYAGTYQQYGSTSGTGAAASFSSPQGVAADGNGNVYVADTYNNTIRKIASGAVVTTFVGSSGINGSADGIQGNPPQFNAPAGIAVDANDNMYVADWLNNTIREITPLGNVTTIAGTAGVSGTADGTGSAIQFFLPSDLAFDHNGNLFVADEINATIRKLTYATGTGWTSTTFAGTSGTGSTNGTGTGASFNSPTALAIDTNNNIYVADSANHLIRKITPAGVVTTLAGSAGVAGSTNATGTAAKFNTPSGVAVDPSGNVYVADSANNLIRMITPAGVVTTLAGATTAGAVDGIGTAARFSSPGRITIDSNGFLYVADTSNSNIRRMTPYGTTWLVITIGGSGYSSTGVGVGTAASFGQPLGLAVDAGGNVIVADTYNYRISIGAPILPPSITGLLTASGMQNSSFTYLITATNMPTPFSSYNASGLPAGLSVNTITGAIAGTPTGSGSFSPALSAINLAGVGNATLTLTINSLTTPYQTWGNANFTPAQLANSAISGDTATPAGDGIPNLMKYALNLAPFANGTAGLPKSGAINVSGVNYLTLTYTQNQSATDLTYYVDVSGDLATWNFGSTYTTLVSTTPNGNGTQTVVVRDNTPMSSANKRFLRLRVAGP